MICPKCKKTYPDDWKFCPDCSIELVPAPVKKEEKPNFTKGIIVIIGIIILAFAWSSMMSPSPKKPVAKDNTRQILLAAKTSGGFIAVRNDNDFDWTNAKMVVSNSPADRYYYEVVTIKKGESKTYPLNAFISYDGKRYNWRAYVPKYVEILATNAAGGMQY